MAHEFNPDRPNPLWTLAAPLMGLAFLGAVFVGLPVSGLVAVLAVFLVGICVFAAVHHAEIIALKVGEPFGSIVLAISVTTIEVALIVSVMLGAPDGAPTMARDAVFASVMIILGALLGFSIILGAARHHEQSYDMRGATAALNVVATLCVIAFVLPHFADGVPGPEYTHKQLFFVGILSLILYCVFLFVQTIRHRDYFLNVGEDETKDATIKPTVKTAFLSLGFLLIALVAVVLIAKSLSPVIATAMIAAGLPPTFLGIVIACIVMLPEGLAAVSAARANRLQTSVNLGLGSAIACIGLTVPTVAIVSLILDQKLTLGITTDQIVLLSLLLLVSSITLGSTGKTTVLHGAVHLMIFVVYLSLAAGLA